MKRSEYRALTSRQGRALQGLLTAGVSTSPPPRSQLAVMLDDAGIDDDKIRQDIVGRIKRLSERTRAGVSRLELTQHANNETVEILKKIRAADDLHGEHGIGTEDDDPAAAADLVDRVHGRARGLSDQQVAEEQAAQAERERLRKMGVNVDGAA